MYLQYSIDNTTEQSFKYMEFIDAKIWISKNVSLCRVFANRVTYDTYHMCMLSTIRVWHVVPCTYGTYHTHMVCTILL